MALGATGAPSIEALAGQLKTPRAIWLMVPSGEIVEKTLNAVLPFIQKGDVVIDELSEVRVSGWNDRVGTGIASGRTHDRTQLIKQRLHGHGER